VLEELEFRTWQYSLACWSHWHRRGGVLIGQVLFRDRIRKIELRLYYVLAL
jgi:hypothetical protein